MKNRKTETRKVWGHKGLRPAMRLAAAGLSAAMVFGTLFSGAVSGFGNTVKAAGSQAPIDPNDPNAQNGQKPAKPSDFKLEVECGYNGTVVPDAYMPVEVTVTNKGKDFVGSVQIIVPGKEGAPNTMYQKDLALSAGSSKKVTLYVLANSPSNKVNVRIMNSKNKQLHSELVRYTSIGAALSCNVGLLTDDIGALSYMDGQYLYPNDAYKTSISELTVSNFPSNWRGLDLLDVIVISNFSTDQLSKEQISALTYWVERGGLLIIGTGSTGSKTLSGLGSLVSYDALGQVRQVETTFGLNYGFHMGAVDEFNDALSYSSSGHGWSSGNVSTITMDNLKDYISHPISVMTIQGGENKEYDLVLPDPVAEELYYEMSGWNSNEWEDYDWMDDDYQGGSSGIMDGWITDNDQDQDQDPDLNPALMNELAPGIRYMDHVIYLEESAVYHADFNPAVITAMTYDPMTLKDPYSSVYPTADYTYLFYALRAVESGAKVTIDPKQKNALLDVLEANHSYTMREMVRRYFHETATVNITDVFGNADSCLYGDILADGQNVGDYVLANCNSLGSGMVVMVPFDFTQTPLPGHDLSGSMFVALIQNLIGHDLTDYLREVINKSNGGYYGGYSSLTAEERRLNNLADRLKGAGAPAVLLIALLLLLYTILLPIVYSAYKKKKKIVKVWYAIPILGVIFTLLIYVVCIPARMNKMTLSEAKILEISSGTDTEKIATAAVMPRIKKYRVSFDGAYDASLLNRENLLYQLLSGGEYDYDTYKIGILDSADHIGYEMVSQKVFESTDFLLQRKDEFGEFENKTVYSSLLGGPLDGTLTNNTNRDLSNAFILLNDEIYYIGDWKVGQTIQLNTLKSDRISRYSWSSVQGQISQAEAIRNVLDRQGIKTLVGFMFGSNGKNYKEDQAKRALVEYAFARHNRSTFTASVIGLSTSTETYGQLSTEKNKWKEYGQTLVFSEIVLNPNSAEDLRQVDPLILPPFDPTSGGQVYSEVGVDQLHTYLVSYNLKSVKLTYMVTANDTEAYFVTDTDIIVGTDGDDYYTSYAYDEFRGTIKIYNHDTGDYDSFQPEDRIPLGPDSPYLEQGMMDVEFDLGSAYYYETVLPELFVSKGGDQ